MPTNEQHNTSQSYSSSHLHPKDKKKKASNKLRMNTDSHHTGDPETATLGIETNHSSSGVAFDGEHQP